jgi:hypothetical protein
MYVCRVFDQLIYNTDRNLGNLVITKDWKLPPATVRTANDQRALLISSFLSLLLFGSGPIEALPCSDPKVFPKRSSLDWPSGSRQRRRH